MASKSFSLSFPRRFIAFLDSGVSKNHSSQLARMSFCPSRRSSDATRSTAVHLRRFNLSPFKTSKNRRRFRRRGFCRLRYVHEAMTVLLRTHCSNIGCIQRGKERKRWRKSMYGLGLKRKCVVEVEIVNVLFVSSLMTIWKSALWIMKRCFRSG